MWMVVYIYFFLKEEDGIRDGTVTGVQTCALPILVVRQLILRDVQLVHFFGVDAARRDPSMYFANPLTERLLPVLVIFWSRDKVLNFHLFKLARAENKVARSNLVAERFSYLRNAERQCFAACLKHVFKINEDSLRGFGPQVYDIILIRDRP